jgi:hypothetical protein
VVLVFLMLLVAMTPIPVISLLSPFKLSEFAISLVALLQPAAVRSVFPIIPFVVIAVFAVVQPSLCSLLSFVVSVVLRPSHGVERGGRRQRSTHKQRSQKLFATMHISPSAG